MSREHTILIVDDNPQALSALDQQFQDDFRVVLAESAEEGLSKLQEQGDLICAAVLDIRMEKMDGLQLASAIKQTHPELPIIFYTAFPGQYKQSDIDQKYEPFEYVGKDESPARLPRAVRHAVEWYNNRKVYPADLVARARTEFNMIGDSPAMCAVYRQIDQIAPSATTVVVLGATGTGKELVARAIHRVSDRKDEVFRAINCGAIHKNLIESELFGHEKGAFTDAREMHVGVFEQADRGTVFLDEIGDLDLQVQVKLLRVLEDQEVWRLRANRPIVVDVRLICATNHNLDELVQQGTFRKDLFYRLKGETIRLPALIDRRTDIPELIDYFVDEHCRREMISRKVFDRRARDLLIEYSWPGNVRELERTVQTLIDRSASDYICERDVQEYLQYSGFSHDEALSYADRVREFKRMLVIQALDRHPDNNSAAARELQMDPANFLKLKKSLGIQ